jgi:ATP-dependent DNA helicase DinG
VPVTADADTEESKLQRWARQTSAVALLGGVVAEHIGPEAVPRYAQRLLAGTVDARMRAAESVEGRPRELLDSEEIAATRSATIAPVGSGKSYAYLVPAALAALRGHRTVISTESINLQTQLADKDVPAVAATIRRLTGAEVRAAVVKGAGNYVCFHQAEDSFDGLASRAGVRLSPEEYLTAHGVKKATNRIATALSDDRDVLAVRLVGWALGRQFLDEDPGDRSACPYEIDDALWRMVSNRRCPGEADAETICGHLRAKACGMRADIVITNHSLLAVQATRGIPTVFGSPSLGRFRHLVVDEAHRLPAVVREQGRRELSPARLRGLAKTLERHRDIAEALSATADTLASTARRLHRRGERETVIDPDSEAIDSLLSGIGELTASARAAVQSGDGNLDHLNALSDLDDVLDAFPDPEDPPDRAVRWTTGEALCVSPIEVGGLVSGRIYLTGSEKEALSVNCVSGTLPRDFTGEAGLGGGLIEHPSPFHDAYEASSAILASPSQQEWDQLAPEGHLDLLAHRVWVRRKLPGLVRANGGATLVLAATSASGKEYADELRTQLSGSGIDVYSQWDGLGLGELVRRFRENTASVLVGVRSLMTGTDVPGQALTQVIIDRVPRPAGNVVDDARVEAKVRSGIRKHSAVQAVYTTAAQLLLAQAVGRLIRSSGDRGRVIVLDPRLDTKAPVSYAAPTRRAYMRALRDFGTVTVMTV